MSTQTSRLETAALRRILVRAVLGSVVFAAVFTAFGAFGPLGEDTDFSSENLAAWLVGVASAVVAAAVVWMTGKAGAAAGNTSGAANRALIFGVLALISFPVFWLGIYAVFAAGSFVLGGASIREATGGMKAKALVGVIIASLATVACASLNLFG